MKFYGFTTVASLISSAESAEALTFLRSSSYGPSPEGFGPQGGGGPSDAFIPGLTPGVFCVGG